MENPMKPRDKKTTTIGTQTHNHRYPIPYKWIVWCPYIAKTFHDAAVTSGFLGLTVAWYVKQLHCLYIKSCCNSCFSDLAEFQAWQLILIIFIFNSYKFNLHFFIPKKKKKKENHSTNCQVSILSKWLQIAFTVMNPLWTGWSLCVLFRVLTRFHCLNHSGYLGV